VQTTRLHESFSRVENSSRSVARGSFSLAKMPSEGDSCFSAVFGISSTTGFSGYNFFSRHARRSIKSSIDADDCLVSKQIFNRKNGLSDQRPRPVKVGKNSKTCLLCYVTKRKPPTQMKPLFFKSKLEDLLNPWMVWTALKPQ